MNVPLPLAPLLQVRISMGEKPGPDGISRPYYSLCQVVAVEERPPGTYK